VGSPGLAYRMSTYECTEENDYVIRVVLNPAIRDYNVSKYVSSSRSLVVLPYVTEATDETSPLMLARGTAREERSKLFVRTVRVLS
jgi:hypothetical protein